MLIGQYVFLSQEFFYLNDRLGIPDAKFLTDEDVDKAKQYIPLYNGQANAVRSKK